MTYYIIWLFRDPWPHSGVIDDGHRASFVNHAQPMIGRDALSDYDAPSFLFVICERRPDASMTCASAASAAAAAIGERSFEQH